MKIIYDASTACESTYGTAKKALSAASRRELSVTHSEAVSSYGGWHGTETGRWLGTSQSVRQDLFLAPTKSQHTLSRSLGVSAIIDDVVKVP